MYRFPIPDLRYFSLAMASVLSKQASAYINFKGNLDFVDGTKPFLCCSKRCLILLVIPPEGFPVFAALKKKLYEKNWNVYSKKSLGGVNSVLGYLGRYTHRVAISNSRIKTIENGEVTFRYKNYQNRGRQQEMTIRCTEFARRFLMHILPKGFYKIRYYGILATANMKTKRQQAIALIGKTIWLPVLEGLTAYEVYRILRGSDPACCPKCKQGMMVRYRIKPASG
jgi:hypothetical protein